MSLHLIVTQPFNSYKRGDMIVDPKVVAATMKGVNRHSVVQCVMKPEHLSGDFFRTDGEIRDRREGKKPKVS